MERLSSRTSKSKPTDKQTSVTLTAKEAKRERILQSAAEVFAERGYHATRISEIARSAGVADGTIYLYFASKDALLIALVEDAIGRFFEVLDREMAALHSARDKLARIVSLQLEMLESHRALARVFTVNLRETRRGLRAHMVPRFQQYLDRIADVVTEGQRRGEFRTDLPPMLVARAVFGALDGVTLTWALGRADMGGLRRASEVVVRVLLEGVGRS